MYIDASLPMGLRSASLCCQRASNAINHICRKNGISVVNYLDDFGGAETWSKAQQAYEGLASILKNSGLTEAMDKACKPSCVMTFLGIQLNTLDLSLTISQDRLDEILSILQKWQCKHTASKHELQELLGKLHFVSRCVRPGRLLVSRLLNFLRQMPDQRKVDIPAEAIQDIKWWIQYMPLYNGVSMMAWEDWSPPDQVVSSDACLTGCGAWVQGECFSTRFPEHIMAQQLHINALELLTIVVAIKTWSKSWKGKRIQVFCDNMASVNVINSGATRDIFQQKCLREMLFFAAKNQFEIRSCHIAGVDNRVSDLLSRAHLDRVLENRNRQCIQNLGLKQVFIPAETFNFIHNW